MKKFRTWYDTRIEEVEVVKETAKFVTVKEYNYLGSAFERRDAKRSDKGQNYFDSWAEAKAFLIDREKDAIQRHINDIKRHEETLQKIAEMDE